MGPLFKTLVALHVAANLVWIGAILSVALAMVSRAGDGRVGAQIAYELYRRLAVPAFVESVVPTPISPEPLTRRKSRVAFVMLTNAEVL